MNYLAHCYLSCSNEDLLLGNVMTDFMRKKEEANYSDKVLQGILLHRSIDAFTDSHPASLELRSMLRKRHDKYASVVVDLIWDRMLCLKWSQYSGESLQSFVKPIYTLLLNRQKELPEKFALRIENMVAGDFLLAYSTEERMLSALKWMDKRVKFPSNFQGAILDLKENEIRITELFSLFFPELIAKVDAICDC